jgi:hypothetical protein
MRSNRKKIEARTSEQHKQMQTESEPQPAPAIPMTPTPSPTLPLYMPPASNAPSDQGKLKGLTCHQVFPC